MFEYESGRLSDEKICISKLVKYQNGWHGRAELPVDIHIMITL